MIRLLMCLLQELDSCLLGLNTIDRGESEAARNCWVSTRRGETREETRIETREHEEAERPTRASLVRKESEGRAKVY